MTQRAAGSRRVLVAVRSAGALHRLLDVLPAFEGDDRITVRFTLVPGSAFDVGALAAVERSGARTVAWDEACAGKHDLVLTASPKGALRTLQGPRALLPHGAGFNKAVGNDGSPQLPSGLDPHYLLTDGELWADLHALAHEEQLARLAQYCPPAAGRAAVVGDPTLDRLLVSLDRREKYREILGTGERRLVVLTSTWGPESLIARDPGMPGALTGLLDHDAYQVALVLHPNEHSRLGSFDLTRHLAPALAAGLILAEPHEEWATLLVASDAVVTDHGSTALYAAALGRAVIAAYRGGSELIPDSPMARLLSQSPRLAAPADLAAILRAAEAVDGRRLAAAAFAQQGHALPRLQHELYRLLELRPPDAAVDPHPLPHPVSAPGSPTAFAVRAEVSGHRVVVRRYAPYASDAAHHLAAAYPEAGQRHLQSAAVVWRRPPGTAPSPHNSTWTAAGWTARFLDDAPGCRTAAVLISPTRCLLRHRSAGPLSIRIAPQRTGGRILRPDPAAVVSAVHAWLGSNPVPDLPVSVLCGSGPLTVRVRVAVAETDDLDYEL